MSLGNPPVCAPSCSAHPGHRVDADSIHLSHVDIFIPQVVLQLTEEDVFLDATVFHTADMIQPAQHALSKQNASTRRTSPLDTLSCHCQGMAKASHVECVEPSLMSGICSPRECARQQAPMLLC